MRVWAVTGGIATGKSSFCNLVRGWEGVTFFDCDACVHDLLTSSEVAAIISPYFPGEQLLADDGGVDRSRLRELVFSDQEKRQTLEGILHPMVRDRFDTTRIGVLAEGGVQLLLADVPLLYEASFNIDQDLDIVVATSPAVQRQRLIERSGHSEEMVENMIGSQMPVAEKMGMADCVIWNDGARESLAAQAATLKNWYFS